MLIQPVVSTERFSWTLNGVDLALGWKGLLNGELEIREILGHHISLFVEPSIRFLADELKDCLNRTTH